MTRRAKIMAVAAVLALLVVVAVEPRTLAAATGVLFCSLPFLYLAASLALACVVAWDCARLGEPAAVWVVLMLVCWPFFGLAYLVNRQSKGGAS